jgi:FeS assembly SUF system regulator
MIRLSKLTDYGFVILTRFVSDGSNGVHNARDVAAEVHLPLPTVSKLLKTFARAGLLTAHRGVKGGYSLARKPTEITVADIVMALEGPISMTECISGERDTSCMLELMCPMKGKWKSVNDMLQSTLNGMTLDQIVAQIPADAMLAQEDCPVCGPDGEKNNEPKRRGKSATRATNAREARSDSEGDKASASAKAGGKG